MSAVVIDFISAPAKCDVIVVESFPLSTIRIFPDFETTNISSPSKSKYVLTEILVESFTVIWVSVDEMSYMAFMLSHECNLFLGDVDAKEIGKDQYLYKVLDIKENTTLTRLGLKDF